MLSYHADADIDTNPFELGYDRLVHLDGADFIGKAALQQVKASGVTRRQVGVVLDGAPLHGPNTSFWPIERDGAVVGKVTSAVYSPRLEQNIALAMVATGASGVGTQLTATTATGLRSATVVETPFFDPKKSLATG